MKKNLHRTWAEFRWTERAFRFYSDLLTGLMCEMPGKEIEGKDKILLSKDPPGPCIPGWTCMVRTVKAKRNLGELGEKVKRLMDEAIQQIERAESKGITEIRFIPSETPSFPDGPGKLSRRGADGGSRAARELAESHT